MDRENNDRLPRVLLLYRSMIPSIRLCGHGQLRVLAKDKRIEYRFKTVYEVSRKELEWADVVFLGRLDGWYEHRLSKALKRSGKYLVYIIDDDLLDIPNGLSVSMYYHRKDVQGWIRSMIDMSSAVLSTSPLLLEKYGQDKEKILTDGFAIDPVAYAEREGRLPIRIGFAGSLDRQSDVECILRNALGRVKQKYGNKVSIEFFGIVPAFARDIDAKVIPYVDNYELYRKKMNEMQWDIGLAPMPDTPFHGKKYYNKLIEYAAAGIVGIYSAIEPYLRLQHEEGIGLFCDNNPDAWYQAICRLIDDAPLREKMRRKANEYVRTNLTDVRAANELKSRMEEILRYRAPECHMHICLKLLKGAALCGRGIDAVHKYKWKLPRKIWEKLSDG